MPADLANPTTASPGAFPAFDTPVEPDGYRWWYVDAISDDGRHALTFIAFIGSVFSPYYAWARRRGVTPAERHSTMNLALYGRPARWCMTERNAESIARSAHSLSIGPSVVECQGDRLDVHIDEIHTPLPRRLRGTLSIALPHAPLAPRALDTDALHHWQPLAPRTRIEVRMSSPELSWSGNAYVDANAGAVPLERSFDRWEWSRWHGEDGATDILYDVLERNGAVSERNLRIDADGRLRDSEVERELTVLAPTRWWRIPRTVRLPAGSRLVGVDTLEDTPFYARSRCRIELERRPLECVQESLLMDRFDHPVTRCLLPFRMPRFAHRAVAPGPVLAD